jgi:hypothetical protein
MRAPGSRPARTTPSSSSLATPRRSTSRCGPTSRWRRPRGRARPRRGCRARELGRDDARPDGAPGRRHRALQLHARPGREGLSTSTRSTATTRWGPGPGRVRRIAARGERRRRAGDARAERLVQPERVAGAGCDHSAPRRSPRRAARGLDHEPEQIPGRRYGSACPRPEAAPTARHDDAAAPRHCPALGIECHVPRISPHAEERPRSSIRERLKSRKVRSVPPSRAAV